ncbi:MAG: hypothetical protein H0T88_06540 [Lysobacter sp.]|nr:hypothetical protein [Lysobacter sp.]
MRIALFFATALAVPTMLLATPAHATTLCTLTYNLAGGGAFYKRSSGDGVVRCDNGQSLAIRIESKAGGLTLGKSTIKNGTGKFSPVKDISDIIGAYATAEASAGTSTAASKAQVVTKGTISLALAGSGTGRTLGVSFGSFVISAK